MRSNAPAVVKVREVEVTFRIDERDVEEMKNIDFLRKQGAIGFEGRRDLVLTNYITVHNVFAIEDVVFTPANDRVQRYMDGSANPAGAYITFKLIVDGAKAVPVVLENLIENGDQQCLTNDSLKRLE